ncbi:MAG TPA: CDP-alcohol phosphatidyltransferase family protein [Pseudomonadales bacterium]|nr:CDP-alcohol phosphatidyltransferase family protein [Pseudomonadales bacterium]
MHRLPNLITILRLLLIAPTGACILGGRPGLALGLFVAAGVSDAVDGWLARRFAWTSRFGAIADPLADKLLVAVVYVLLAVQGVLPAWLAALVVLRDLIIIGGALVYHLRVERLEMAPTLLGKLNTLAHILFVALVLASLTAPSVAWLGASVAPGVVLIAALTLISGADYVRVWSARARGAARERPVADAGRLEDV